MSSRRRHPVPPRVLELRVHGINSTIPYGLLDLPVDEVERVAGDSLSSFWTPSAASLAKNTPDAAGRRGFVPAGIRREAYSWGGLVRGTPGGTGPGGVVLAGVARVGWALLLPFSIANAAIWAIRLPTGVGVRRLSLPAGLVRLFGVLLTLLLVATGTSVTVDILARQCFRGGAAVCAVLPAPLQALAAWTTGHRMALFSLVPVALIVGLWFLARLSRLRYDVADRYLDARSRPAAADGVRPGPLLARPDFWSRRGGTHRFALGQLASGLSLISLMLGAFSVRDGGGAPVATTTLVSAGLLLVGLGTVFGTRTLPTEAVPAAPAARWHLLLVAAAGAGYLATVLCLIWGPGGTAAAEPVVPAESGSTVSALTLLWLTGAMLVIVVASAFLRWLPGGAPRKPRFEAWRGLAPSVFLCLSLGIGLVLSSLVTVGVGDWLNGAAGASSLLGSAPGADAGGPAVPACQGGCVVRDPQLVVPTLYPWFGGAALLLLAAVLLVVGAALARPRRVGARVAAWLSGGAALPVPDGGQAGTGAGSEVPLKVGSGEELRVLLGPVRDRQRATAARWHLVEPFVGILAAAAFVSVLASEVLSLVFPRLDVAEALPVPADLARAWLDIAMGAWAAVAVLVLVGLALPTGPGAGARPLAIVWDLACFLPRVGHPLGPPCYAERAVPEVSRRILWWLQGNDAPASSRPRAVVLAAHSMGGVVALAALFSLASHPEWRRLAERMSLLTFGVQVRPYFGRFFPELLGPAVLGTRPCLGPDLWTADPWQADAAEPRPAPDVSAASGVSATIPPGDEEAPPIPTPIVPARQWISLWRATDPLGFPAWSNRPGDNPLDRFADEIDTSGYIGEVGMHRHYYRTRQYRVALAELAWSAPPPDGAG